ncbi:hypothetical protein Tco_0630634 [Tanacetum coccineum]
MGTMFLNMDQLEKQLDKDEFQEIGSMAAFRVLETQFQQFRDTLIQHMESVKKSIDKRALHKREYDSRVNERQMQKMEEKVDTSKELDASLVDIKSGGTESGKQDTRNNSGNNADTDDADIKPEEQNLDLSAGTPFNLKKDRIKAWIKENVISGRPRLHGIALIQEISARQNFQGIRNLLTS